MSSTKVGSIHYDLDLNTKGFDKATKSIASKLDDTVSVIGKTIKRTAALGSAMAAAGAVIGVKTAGELETANLMFETLMGSAEEAQKHVESLFDYAKLTPFETQPIIEASRLMYTFGGAALATRDNLEMVGDAAAATNTNIEEIGFWVGRAYSMIDAGKPFGEAAMRLQEMGVLSATARAKMEELQEAGASSKDVFAVLTKDIDRFNGATLKQAGTMQGLTSTLKDVVSLDLAYVFEPLFETTKKAMGALVAFSESDAWQGIKDRARDSVGVVASYLNNIIDIIQSDGVKAALEKLKSDFLDIDFKAIFSNILSRLNVAEFARNLLSKMAMAINSVNYEVLTRDLTTILVAVIGGIKWGYIVSQLIPVFPKIANDIMTGFVSGIFNWIKNDPIDFLVTLALLLLAPAKFVKAIGGALAKVPLVGTLLSWIFKAIAFLPQAVGGVIRSAFARIARQIMFTFKLNLGVHWVLVSEWFKRMASKILSAVGGSLYQAGRKLILGLVDGIKSVAGAPVEAARGILSKVRNLFPFSPAKEGPFSGKGWTLYSGMALMQGLADGINRKVSLPQTAMGDAMTGVKSFEMQSPSSSSGGSIAGSNITINMDGIMARSAADMRDLFNEGLALVNQQRRAQGKPAL